MSSNLGSACQTAALPFAPAGFPANASPNRQPFAVPRFGQGTASLKHSLYASTFMVGYLGVFFGAGYVALNVVEWAWSAIVH
jgi:hypothetical protein